MKNITSHVPSTLEEIVLLKNKQLDEIKIQRQVLANDFRELFTPFESSFMKGQSIVRTLNTGITIFDGFMAGLKIMRKIKKIFKFKHF
jgi:hypothetical protein